MKKIIVVISIFLFANIAIAKEYEIIDSRNTNNFSEVPSFILFNTKGAPEAASLNEFVERYLKNSNRLTLKMVREEEDQLGYTHQLYQQEFDNVPIAFSQLRVHLLRGKIQSMNGSLVHDAPAYREQSLTEEEALKAALEYIGAAEYKWENQAEEDHLMALGGELTTYYPKGTLSYVAPNAVINHKELRLAYRFNIYAAQPLSRTEIYVDASNGKIIFTNDLIHTGNSKGTAHTAYSGVQSITTDSVNVNQYRLRQTLSGRGVNTFNMNSGRIHGNATDFLDSNNIWNNINSSLDQYATDAHWGAEQTYDYFFTKFNRNSINNNGFPLNSYEHYSPNGLRYANAFWDGQRMTYGDGGNGYNPLTALDIAAHEISHGLTTFTANLIYASESGALNESFSDIFGTAVEMYARPNRANWTIGEDIGRSLRNMANPKAHNDPNTRGGTYWRTVVGCMPSQQNDNCGVHTNSGVQNYWFYLLTEGGSGRNDLNHTYAVQGVGIDTAAAIAFRNLTVYLGRNSDYDDARFYSIRSAIDLYGTCSRAVEAVTNAWYAVGVGNPYVNGVVADFTTLDVETCEPPYKVTFTENSSNVLNYDWSFGDGQSSTQSSPTHTYTTYGDFDVQLIIDGGNCGSDTLIKTSYISIDSSNNCRVNLQNGVNPDKVSCSGVLFDNGGASGTYAPNQNATITIKPINAASVSLSFTSFDVEQGSLSSICDYDYLEIFDGASVNSPSLGRFCNNKLPPASITSSRGAITIKFVTDPGLERNGFEMNWSCNYATKAPIADFLADSDTTCTGEINFTDFSKEGPDNWLWDFGDGNTANTQDPTHYYVDNGTYSVKLISSNSFGVDSVIKSQLVHVNRPSRAAVTNDTVCVNGNAILKASGSGSLEWYTDEFGGTSINSNNIFQVNNLIGDTSFWVENFHGAAVNNLGPTYNTIGSGSYYSGDQYQIFDVYKTIVLKEVFIYGGSAGNRTVELRDKNGVVLQSKTVYIPARLINVVLDFQIEAGTDYQLGVSNGNNASNIPDLYRNNQGVNYPYTVPGLLSIKGSSAGNSYYYFFYNWRVKELDCYSAREEVFAKVDTTCIISSLAKFENDQELILFPNPAKDEFYISFKAAEDVKHITLYNSKGAAVKTQPLTVNDFSSGKFRMSTSTLSEGVYFVNLKLRNSTIRKRLIIIR